MREQSCGSCRFWLSRPIEGSRSEGLCRRCPPTAHTWVSASRGSAETLTMAQFPPMDADSWCGEWQADDDERMSLAPGRTAGALSPPTRTTAAIDGPTWDESPPEWEDDAIDLVDSGPEEPDPFDAILKTDDTKLWEGAAALDADEPNVAAAPTSSADNFDDSIVAADESIILTPQSLSAEALDEVDAPGEEPAPDNAHDAASDDPRYAEDATQTATPSGHSAAAEESDVDLISSWRSANASPPVDDLAAPKFSVDDASDRPSLDQPPRDVMSEFPDPEEWSDDLLVADMSGRDASGFRAPAAETASPANNGDEWPDWSEWLNDYSNAELRLDNVVGPADTDRETGTATAAAGEDANRDSMGEAATDDREPGTSSPIPEPPPWLNEPPKPGFLGWARRSWR